MTRASASIDDDGSDLRRLPARRLPYRTRLLAALPPGLRRGIRDAALKSVERPVVAAFHGLFYASSPRTWDDMSWLGVSVLKCPFDLWNYQEIIVELRPDFIIETGTWDGGSALYMASICDLVDRGHIITIDVADPGGRPEHPRITYVTGSSVADDVVNHRCEHVFEELQTYSEIVTPGSYLIVEDTNLNGHPVGRWHGPGPMEAVERFLATNHSFVVDRSRQKFFLTFNPRGYLRRLA
jgi:cephalosporin hydroxylase